MVDTLEWGSFELSDTIKLGAKPFEEVLSLMADMHKVFENLNKQ